MSRYTEEQDRDSRIRAKCFELSELIVDNLIAAMSGEQGAKRRFAAPLMMVGIAVCKLCEVKISPATRPMRDALMSIRNSLDDAREVEGARGLIPDLGFGAPRKKD
jgi:hypothetical protein